MGWHLENEQKSSIKNHCSTVLQSFRKYWEKDVRFTMDLLSQLLEDIDACTTKLDSKDTLKDFASFLGVYNTVLKCIYTSGEFVTLQFVTELVS